MAVSTNSYFSNSIIGVPQVGADIDIYETGSNPKYAIGFGFERADGNKYRYCHFGAISDKGEIVGTDNLESSTTSTAMSLQVVSPTIYTPAGETIAPNKVGSRYLQINNTGANLSVAQLTADVWAGGTICFVAGSGTGLSYRIKGNSASGTPATGETYIELYSPLVETVDTTTAFVVQGPKYANLEPAGGIVPRYQTPVGFCVVGNSASSYAWICTKGITSALLGAGALGSTGNGVVTHTTTPGSVQVNATPITGNSSEANLATVAVIVNSYSASTYTIVNACLE